MTFDYSQFTDQGETRDEEPTAAEYAQWDREWDEYYEENEE